MSAYDPISKTFAPNTLLTAADLNTFKADVYSSIANGNTPILGYTLPTASGVVLGGVKVDGSTIAISSTGVISAAAYILPVATASTIGAVKQGMGIAIATDGTISTTAASPAPLSGISINGTTIVASSTVPYQMATVDRVVDVNKTTGAATGIILPVNPTLWADYTVIDGKRDSSTNNITISATSGAAIDGVGSFVISTNGGAVSFRAVSATTWRIS